MSKEGFKIKNPKVEEYYKYPGAEPIYKRYNN